MASCCISAQNRDSSFTSLMADEAFTHLPLATGFSYLPSGLPRPLTPETSLSLATCLWPRECEITFFHGRKSGI